MNNRYFLFFLINIITGVPHITVGQVTGQIKIGSDIWTISNLNVSKFRNGDPIPEAKTKEQWIKASENKKPAWCHYNNSPQNSTAYGKLYNWYAINDQRGIAPKGWHVATLEEWNQLIDTLQNIGNVSYNLKAKSGWKNYEDGGYQVGSDCPYCEGRGQRFSRTSGRYITCAICGGSGGDKYFVPKKILSGNGTNKSGFLAKPGSCRSDDGDFHRSLGSLAAWWVADEANLNESYHIFINGENSISDKNLVVSKGYGLSVRLVKDKNIKEKARKVEVSTTPNYVPTNGLVGWWSFNGNAKDESGNANHGAIHGAMLTSDRNEKNNSAYYFDGIDDWIEIPNSSNLTLTSNMSMSAWIQTSGSNKLNYQSIISKRATYWTWEYAMGLSYHSGRIHNTKMITARALGEGNGKYAWSKNSFTPSLWEFWTVVYSDGNVKIYKNGILDAIYPFTLTPRAQNCPLLFGRNTLVDTSEHFFGKIDDIGIWNRALSPQEVMQLYQATNGVASNTLSSNINLK